MKYIKKETMIKELPFDERPREKLQRQGIGCLSNAELLAILIGSGTKDASAIVLANRILALEKNGISFLADCMPEELSHIPGIGMAKSCQIVAAIELGKRIATKPKEKKLNIKSPKDAATLFIEEMRYLKKEFFKVLLLNTKNEIIMIENISIGNLNSSMVHPREVFCTAVKKSAYSMIVVHNHPSGNPIPSQADIDITRRLVEAGEILGIKVLDHLIIGDGIYISLKEKNLM
ncbi:RadC family protein [Sinanaerobacter chloroacetimidivorans]|uniref:DNA repair protein RadC n=1 Tax=Sinanaerobacter chloroacetimidivorans TaxID=2818044 RepID=A0A8J7W2X8_9FIRM|nr:DNA repair protein RadC [Sinanaerobacter chloroacetimidivorans]MBR0599494.1 DNA repair protein RadC [Sinanaerobacter chloroacetimidivorans]